MNKKIYFPLLITWLLFSLAGKAQIEVDAYKNLLLGGAEAPEVESMSNTNLYQPQILMNFYEDMYWQRINNFFKIEFYGEGLHFSGSGNRIVLFNTQTSLYNSIWTSDGNIDWQTLIYVNRSSLAGNAMNLLSRLRPVTYTWKEKTGSRSSEGLQYGFLAQEVEQVLPEIVSSDSVGHKTMNYYALLPLLTSSIQHLQSRMAQQQAQTTHLQSSIALRPASADEVSLSVVPTSASKEAMVEYVIPSTTHEASLLIHTMDHNVLKSIPLTKFGTAATCQMEASDLGAGLFMCTLLIDGQPRVTKNLVITNR